MIRKSWKAILSLLAIPALSVAGRSLAQESCCYVQQSNGSSDGLYVMPDAGASASASASSVPEATGKLTAQYYLNSLDTQGEQFQRDLEKAEAKRVVAASVTRPRELAAAGDSPNSTVWTPNAAERVWIPIGAGIGLLVSLLAGGYVWWSRTRFSRTERAVIFAVKRQPAAEAGRAEKQPDEASKRRAA